MSKKLTKQQIERLVQEAYGERSFQEIDDVDKCWDKFSATGKWDLLHSILQNQVLFKVENIKNVSVGELLLNSVKILGLQLNLDQMQKLIGDIEEKMPY